MILRIYVLLSLQVLISFTLSASTLGIHTTYANQFHPAEVVPISRIVGPLALIPVYSRIINKDLWISVSFDHVSTVSISIVNV